MKARLVAFVVSEGIALDALTNRFTAFNMLDAIMAPQVPALLAKVALLLVYELGDEPESYLERVRIAHGEKVLAESTSMVNLIPRNPGDPLTAHRSMHVIWGVQFSSFGDCRIVAERAASSEGPWTLIAERRLPVVRGNPPFAPAGIPIEPSKLRDTPAGSAAPTTGKKH